MGGARRARACDHVMMALRRDKSAGEGPRKRVDQMWESRAPRRFQRRRPNAWTSLGASGAVSQACAGVVRDRPRRAGLAAQPLGLGAVRARGFSVFPLPQPGRRAAGQHAEHRGEKKQRETAARVTAAKAASSSAANGSNETVTMWRLAKANTSSMIAIGARTMNLRRFFIADFLRARSPSSSERGPPSRETQETTNGKWRPRRAAHAGDVLFNRSRISLPVLKNGTSFSITGT